MVLDPTSVALTGGLSAYQHLTHLKTVLCALSPTKPGRLDSIMLIVIILGSEAVGHFN